MIRALAQVYRQSGDEVALELARRFASDNLESAFNADGGIRAEAGTHMHSITGTITGLIDYGLLMDDEAIIERARRAYDKGMAPYRSSYGWVKEFRWESWLAEPLAAAGYAGFDVNRGEANNTGDLIEAALLLGGLGYADYYEDADRMLRNHLLASQVVDSAWVAEAVGHRGQRRGAFWRCGAARPWRLLFRRDQRPHLIPGRSLSGECRSRRRFNASDLRSLGGDCRR